MKVPAGFYNRFSSSKRFFQDMAMKIRRLEEVTIIPEPRELTPEQLKEAYALAKTAFTAEDLQRYTEVDEGVPMEQVLAELEEIHNQINRGKEPR
jgi:hypothetical protein